MSYREDFFPGETVRVLNGRYRNKEGEILHSFNTRAGMIYEVSLKMEGCRYNYRSGSHRDDEYVKLITKVSGDNIELVNERPDDDTYKGKRLLYL